MKVLTMQNTPIREEPGVTTKFISSNEKADAIDEYSDVLEVRYNSKKYELWSKLIIEKDGKYIAEDISKLNTDGVESTIEQIIPAGKEVQITKTYPKWYKLKFEDGREGWAHKGKLKIVEK